MSGFTKFQTHCQNLIDKLNDTIKNEFKDINDDLSRIKYLYSIAKDDKIELSRWAPKDIERAESLKVSGNKLFQSRNFFHAVNVYNEALLRCPQDHLEGLKLHAILIANRSAVFYEMKEYNKVLTDVAFLQSYGHHPAMHKLYTRAGKACEALKTFKDALQYYNNALSNLENADIKESEWKKQVAEIENRIIALKIQKLPAQKPLKSSEMAKIDVKNITYPALSAKIIVKSAPDLGRYVVAKEDIKAGEIIGIEEPYVSVVYKETYRTNCATCMRSINQMIVCANCCHACYCSFDCKEKAQFHKSECKILLSLFESGASLNCLMALRMITQRDLEQVIDEYKDLEKERNIVIYKSDDIYNVYNLVSHAERRNFDEFMHYTFMSTYLLRLLKQTDYFRLVTDDDVLSEDEAIVGSLILRNLQILQFNAHEIAELQYNLNMAEDDANYKSETVGAGLYPTLALFNHSCDPSVIRYNVGKTMVLVAIKPIKRNEGVYENYGPLYTSDMREERIAKLRKLYWFDCRCQACTEEWLLFKNMDPNSLRIACDCGNVLIAAKDLEDPTLNCAKCKKDKTLMPVLIGLIPLEPKSIKVEDLFSKSKYKEALSIIVDMMQIYMKYLVPPFRDMIMLQQRLKTCLVHLGNKKFDYKI